MPRRHSNADRQRTTRPITTSTLAVVDGIERKPPKPINSVDIAKTAVSKFVNDDRTPADVKKAAIDALVSWGRPATVTESERQRMLGKLDVFEFWKARLQKTGSALLLFSVASQTDQNDRFSPVPQSALELADRHLFATLEGNMDLLAQLEMPVPFGLKIVTRSWNDSSWHSRIEAPNVQPLNTRLANYDRQTLSDLSANLPVNTTVEYY